MNGANVQHLQLHGTTRVVKDEKDEAVQRSNGDSIDKKTPSQIVYNAPHSPHALHDSGGDGDMNGVEVVGRHALYDSGLAPVVASAGGDVGADQLTLSFQGKVYVFDFATLEKVQAVLLQLGGNEVPTGIPTPGMTPPNPRGLADQLGRSSQPQRDASLNRFREKRKERCFGKKIRYTVRQEVARSSIQKSEIQTAANTSTLSAKLDLVNDHIVEEIRSVRTEMSSKFNDLSTQMGVALHFLERHHSGSEVDTKGEKKKD